MKLLSFSVDGRESWGVVNEDGVVDLGCRSELGWPTLLSALQEGDLTNIAAKSTGLPADHALADVRLLPVVVDPGKILCVGLNYEGHRFETGRPRTEHPVIFVRFADSLTGHGSPLIKPSDSAQFDYEGELAVIIGEPCRRVPQDRALEYVAGYTCFNDGSLRDFQAHTHQFTPGKNFPATGAVGPWLVTPDEFGSIPDAKLTTRLNGTVVQQAELSDLTYSIAEIVAYCSTWTTLRPGDVIATGTPSGVGSRREPPLWMRPGDVCEVDVDKIGVLRNPISAEEALPIDA
ncbi:fumarylacetoacetate hydrolase family protein [Saccharopolyspora erythraea]|uniref:fumarylacetoacetate hydrolase family protein n=1 Tax=Saccharopolyspora erythraea TaxID=1836 RepID=UPI001BACDA24|nr:fumarylacetoacetate hydrolase family protein [Saccharopolyspora erythraea]QUH01806.1 fumarylacetoacetate hydrolase family protein [Saccharopolyspora erythraea]